MVEESGEVQFLRDLQAKVHDLEEKQKILRERVLLVGKNFIEFKEDQQKKNIEFKKTMEIMKGTLDKMSAFLESASTEFSKYARKEDVEILTKQARMFEPFGKMSRTSEAKN